MIWLAGWRFGAVSRPKSGGVWTKFRNFLGLIAPNGRFDSCDETRATVLNRTCLVQVWLQVPR